jgi:hypothetical protein
MLDPILSARLNALDQNLASAKDHEWLKTELDQVDVADEVWDGLDATIGREARGHATSIEALRNRLREAEGKDEADTELEVINAWAEYGKVLQESQDLFGEFLEFIGGLAFRSRRLDERICNVADELIQSCSKDTIGDTWQSVTVPAPREAIKKTLAAIIRLRFPERTVWTLPFAAHEFGHVLMDEDRDLQRFVDKHARTWRAQGVRFGRGRGRPMSMAHAQDYLDELLADAFATYYMGPAYAAAAVHLRFDPTTAQREDEEHPSDLKRARVVLSMLERMNRDVPMKPYGNVLDRLRDDWDTVSRRSGVPRLGPTEEDRLNELAEAAHAEFTRVLRSSAEYPAAGHGGWLVAVTWQEQWHQKVTRRQTLSVPDDVNRTSKLRDALNAAWMFRILHPAEVREATTPALRLCEAIIRERRGTAASTSARTAG